jgi:hypothetical protein
VLGRTPSDLGRSQTTDDRAGPSLTTLMCTRYAPPTSGWRSTKSCWSTCTTIEAALPRPCGGRKRSRRSRIPPSLRRTLACRGVRTQGFTRGTSPPRWLLARLLLDRNGGDGAALLPPDDWKFADLLVRSASRCRRRSEAIALPPESSIPHGKDGRVVNERFSQHCRYSDRSKQRRRYRPGAEQSRPRRIGALCRRLSDAEAQFSVDVGRRGSW